MAKDWESRLTDLFRPRQLWLESFREHRLSQANCSLFLRNQQRGTEWRSWGLAALPCATRTQTREWNATWCLTCRHASDRMVPLCRGWLRQFLRSRYWLSSTRKSHSQMKAHQRHPSWWICTKCSWRSLSSSPWNSSLSFGGAPDAQVHTCADHQTSLQPLGGCMPRMN